MSDDTKELLLDAAFAEFAEKGKAGGRMQAIANRAGINKAMLNYYFTSKDELYEAVIERGLQNLRKSLVNQIDHTKSMQEIILSAIEQYVRYWSKNVDLLKLIFTDMHTGGNAMRKAIQNVVEAKERMEFISAITKSGVLREHDPRQLLFHFTGLTLPFLIQMPVVAGFFPDRTYDEIVEDRIRAVKDLLVNGLFVKSPQSNDTDICATS